MFTIKTFLAASPISGMGVFCAEDVAEGAPIWRFDPAIDLLIPMREYIAMSPDLKDKLAIYMYADHSVYVDGYILNMDLAKYMNHSRNANVGGKGHTNSATRNISAGEELTCDYRTFDWPLAEDIPVYL